MPTMCKISLLFEKNEIKYEFSRLDATCPPKRHPYQINHVSKHLTCATAHNQPFVHGAPILIIIVESL